MRNVAIRLYEPITLLFPEGAAMPQLRGTVRALPCILCEGLASPPSRMGWLETPERQAVFVCCGACSDCNDKELERRIVAKVSEQRPVTTAHTGLQPETADGASATEATWVGTAAKAWSAPAIAHRQRATA
jgi:hypothetical protein